MADSLAIVLDLGTTSIKGAVFNAESELETVFRKQAPPVIQSGERFESDALEYVKLCNELFLSCLSTAKGNPPLGISVQRSSFVIWQKSSGKPVIPLISWQDSRAAGLCRNLSFDRECLREMTGLWLTPYFFAPKVGYVLSEQRELRNGLEQGELLIGTLDTFLIWLWSKEKVFRTDSSMAARTSLFDLSQQNWSKDLSQLFEVSTEFLPTIGRSEQVGVDLKHGVKLQASVGDQSAGLLGATRGKKGDIVVNLGTGGFVCCWIDEIDGVEHLGRYQKTLIYQDASSTCHFALEGTLNSIGRALDMYACQDCSLDADERLTDYFCIAEPSGLGAPFFRDDIKLCFSKAIQDLSSRQVSLLVVEAVIFRIKQILDDFDRISGINAVFLAGGWSRSLAIQQGIAQCSPVAVHLLQEPEVSLVGVARLAAGKPGLSKSIRVEASKESEYLRLKYVGWREWLEELLKS